MKIRLSKLPQKARDRLRNDPELGFEMKPLIDTHHKVSRKYNKKYRFNEFKKNKLYQHYSQYRQRYNYGGIAVTGLSTLAGIAAATKEYMDAQVEIKERAKFDELKSATDAYFEHVKDIDQATNRYLNQWNRNYEAKKIQYNNLKRTTEALKAEIQKLADIHQSNWDRYHQITGYKYKDLENKAKAHLHKLSKGKGTGWTLPQTNYVGPGNDMNKFVVSDTDAIAFAHDWRYELAFYNDEINDADKLAISEFAREYEKNGNWQAMVGKLGLSAKSWLYDHFGFYFYPRLEQRQSTSTDIKETSSSEIRLVIQTCLAGNHLISLPGKGLIGPLLTKGKNYMLFKLINSCWLKKILLYLNGRQISPRC